MSDLNISANMTVPGQGEPRAEPSLDEQIADQMGRVEGVVQRMAYEFSVLKELEKRRKAAASEPSGES